MPEVMSAKAPCRFEKALISRVAECLHAKQYLVGERQGFYCCSPAYAKRCDSYLQLLRQNIRFVFKQARANNSILTNYQETCLQCGGLQGLVFTTKGWSNGDLLEVSILLEAAESEYQGLENIPINQVVSHIAAYNPRPRRKKNQK